MKQMLNQFYMEEVKDKMENNFYRKLGKILDFIELKAVSLEVKTESFSITGATFYYKDYEFTLEAEFSNGKRWFAASGEYRAPIDFIYPTKIDTIETDDPDIVIHFYKEIMRKIDESRAN